MDNFQLNNVLDRRIFILTDIVAAHTQKMYMYMYIGSTTAKTQQLPAASSLWNFAAVAV